MLGLDRRSRVLNFKNYNFHWLSARPSDGLQILRIAVSLSNPSPEVLAFMSDMARVCRKYLNAALWLILEDSRVTKRC